MKFQPPRGTRDMMPEQMRKLLFVTDTLRSIFEKYGYEPLETPAFEDWRLLSAKSGGGEEIKKEIFYFKDKSSRELGLRFDLTVPLARIAAGMQLAKPFRRYQIGRVWRYDRPGAGRWREFWQADVDIVGSALPIADAEVIAIACEAFKALGIDVTVRISNRKIAESFVRLLGIKNIADVFRSIDKLEKVGEDTVSRELKSKGIGNDKIRKMMEFIKIKDIAEIKKVAPEGVGELEDIMAMLKCYGFAAELDMSLVRGLEYYTGAVFEIAAKVKASEARLSIAGGGRYDSLIEKFGGKATPATGISFGIGRIMELLPDRKEPNTRIYIASVNAEAKDIIKITKSLRLAGIACETDVMQRPLKRQLEYVNAKSIPFVLFVGWKELASGKLELRDMKSGKQQEIKIGEIEKIKEIVG